MFLDPNVIYQDRRARQRAKWLFNYVRSEALSSPEFTETRLNLAPDAESSRSPGVEHVKVKPFPKMWSQADERDGDLEEDRGLQLVTEVANSYPRLVSWLTEGRVSRYWNVFGIVVSVLRTIPVVRWVVWQLIFKPVARHAPWRFALCEVILQQERYQLNNRLGNHKLSDKLVMTDCTQGLSAVTDAAMIAPTTSRAELRLRSRRCRRAASASVGCPELVRQH